MARAVCERCARPQPVDWREGDLCALCGAAARREVRCAWCARWTPAGRFCRACGSELVDDARWGAARMLKKGGVDQFSLKGRLDALHPGQAENLSRLFETQRAVVARRVDEAALCESALLAPSFSSALEDDLVAKLPLAEGELAVLAGGPAGPFEGRFDLLKQILEHSPIEETRTLAALALLRRGELDEDSVERARLALGEKGPLAVESALAFASWRVRGQLPPQWVDPLTIAELATPGLDDPRLAPWSAVGCSLLAEHLARLDEYGRDLTERRHAAQLARCRLTGLEGPLGEGLAKGDPDLRFACALALGREEIVARALDGDDAGMRRAALAWLAGRGSGEVGPALADGSDDDRMRVLKAIAEPVPEVLEEAALLALERTRDDDVREKATNRLRARLTPQLVERIARAAEAARDADSLRLLLWAKPLPAGGEAVRAAFRAGLAEKVKDPLVQAAREGFVPAEVGREILAGAATDNAVREALLLAEPLLERTRDAGLHRLVVRAALGPWSAEAREDAVWALKRVEKSVGAAMAPFALDSRFAAQFFGGAEPLFASLAGALEAAARQRTVSIDEWLCDLLREIEPALLASLTPDAAVRSRMVDALLAVVPSDAWLYLRTRAASVVALFGGTPELRQRSLEAVERLFRRGDENFDLRYALARAAKSLGGTDPEYDQY